MTARPRHTGIVVSDLDAALHFYGELLGFETVRRAEESGAALGNILALDGTQVTTIKMEAGNGQIELLHFGSPARQATRNGQLSADSLGLTHIAVTVDDLDATYARIEAAGVRFNAPPQVSADGLVKLTYCRDPDGSFVELVEVLNGTSAQPTNRGGFVEVTEEGYTDLLIRRLKGEEAELTFVQQFRGLLAADLRPGASLLDVGCATGYAYHGFRAAGVACTCIDIEERYLAIARDWFAGQPEAEFANHDITAGPYDGSFDMVICNAVLDHLPSLEPALTNMAASAGGTFILRTFLGEREEIFTRAAPNPRYAASHRKYSNQYAFRDVLASLAKAGLKSEVVRDRHTDSLPRWVDGVAHAFFIVQARRV